MMEKLGEPQTHLGLKAMIKEVDEDNDGQISFREVSDIFGICGREKWYATSTIHELQGHCIDFPQVPNFNLLCRVIFEAKSKLR